MTELTRIIPKAAVVLPCHAGINIKPFSATLELLLILHFLALLHLWRYCSGVNEDAFVVSKVSLGFESGFVFIKLALIQLSPLLE